MDALHGHVIGIDAGGGGDLAPQRAVGIVAQNAPVQGHNTYRAEESSNTIPLAQSGCSTVRRRSPETNGCPNGGVMSQRNLATRGGRPAAARTAGA